MGMLSNSGNFVRFSVEGDLLRPLLREATEDARKDRLDPAMVAVLSYVEVKKEISTQ